ncbi:hypothetical protein QYE76_065279 [Lolium multiflorum]|uniref:Reverse transcriptase domain-containing protein n=1 Tax=Lolium multiflorum TaxID=4521 RepID=A0AAD8S8K1_LOLMU|nr:hypothetical protein QYE76_065279 [Lolium multiflorum]
MTTQAVTSQPQQSPYTNKRRTVTTAIAAAISAKTLMTRRVADPTWSPWRSNAEVQEAEEDAAVEAERQGSAAWHRGHSWRIPRPANLRGVGTCPAWPTWIRLRKSTHTNRNCKWVNDLKNDPEAGYKRARKHRPRGKGGKGKNKDKDEDSSEAMDEDDNSPDPKAGSAGKSNPFEKKSVGAYHTFLGTPTVRATKSAARILNAIVPAGSMSDGYDFSKCLMDGGASLNIMYLETLERMNLTKEQLKHSTTEFHGVVPGKKANSLGSITLPVAFGDVHNFREERITFEVVPFKSSYHVIFGRPTYHKFHARACYIYNKLKIPGPKVPPYQRTMQRCLKDQIGRNVHAYVDDIAVMTRKGSDLIGDLTETFENLRRKLRHYFQEHPRTVVSKAPLSTILNNADATRRTAKWGIELSAFDITYKARTAVKSQVLADFVADWTEAPDAYLEPEPETWVMHFDGSKQHQGSGAGVT